MTDAFLYFNGINAVSGSYLLPPMQAEQLSAIVGGDKIDPLQLEELKFWYDRMKHNDFGYKEGIDPKFIEQTGWGIIFPHDMEAEVVDALKPLIEWRRSQASLLKDYYFKLYTGADGYRPGDSKNSWMTRNGAGPGPADPEKVPYYLLIVGGPERIPYRFQTQLDVQYAVGRVSFDSVEEYARYAQSVVEAEQQQIRLARKVSFFGVSNPDDPATRMSTENLITPLAQALSGTSELIGWRYPIFASQSADKEQAARLIGGPDTPSLLFTASHGMGFPKDHPLQLRHSGALLCQNWPGPRQWRKEIPEDFYFSGDDISSDAKLWGLISFFFACYGAGTPQYDEFAQQAFKDQRAEIAPKAFVSRLPQRMLAHPKGGALAVIGHVERAWGYSFMWGKAGKQVAVFESTLHRLLDGYPVGAAFEFFNQRYAELSTDLSAALEDLSFGKAVSPYELSGMWTSNNDARNYVILGDPAVRMMVAEEGVTPVEERPSIIVSSPVEGSGEHEAAIVPAATAALIETPGGEAFGVLDNLRDGAGKVGGALETLGQKLGEFLGKAIENAATLQVRTYTSTSIDQVSIQDGRIVGANLRALTAIKIDGDVDQVVPVEDGEVNTGLWAVHLEMVKQAEETRSELIKSAISAAASLANLSGK